MYTNIVNSRKLLGKDKKLISDTKTKSPLGKKKVVYMKQTKILTDIGNKLKKEYLLSKSQLNIHKLSLNELLNFFDQEKQNLDNQWNELSLTSEANNSNFQKLNNKSANLSLNISKLGAKALEYSVELDIDADQNIISEDIDECYNSREALFNVTEAKVPKLNQYHNVLTNILDLCRKYHDLTEEVTKLANKGN